MDQQQKRRVQNRLNQRARRDRLRDYDRKRTNKRAMFVTSQWKLDEFDYKSQHAGKGRDLQIPSIFYRLEEAALDDYALRFSPQSPKDRSWNHVPSTSPEQLLNLINFNTFRGMFQNKSLLSKLSHHFMSTPNGSSLINIMEGLPRQAIIVPSSQSIPPYLVPTSKQKTVFHATWIDFVPFPRMRDNLICHHEEFDHQALVRDMVGDLIDIFLLPRPSKNTTPPQSRVVTLRDGLDDDMTANRNGMIIWGDSHRADSWEATPGFFRKWGWAVEGCDELIRSTNYWRSIRHEDPILL